MDWESSADVEPAQGGEASKPEMSGPAHTVPMATTPAFERAIHRATTSRHQALRDDLMRLREDAGATRSLLAAHAGVDPAYLGRIEEDNGHPPIETYQRLAAALGADLSARIYPNTGPAIRHRHQARMLELLLSVLHPRWRPFTEVAVRRPSRGWIDAALHDAAAHLLVASELQSELRRLEQLIRLSAEKAAALPSWDGWPLFDPEPQISMLLVVRHTRATRTVATDFERQLRVAYPGHPDDALRALSGAGP